jgi:predicted RNase H-like HicB family nuclease
MNKVVRCYAEGRDGQWEAVCLEFDIAVQGQSLEEVVQSLRSAIAAYLDYVGGLPEKEQARFLNRRVPWLLRLQFFWHMLFAHRRQSVEGAQLRAGFELPATA